MYMQVTYLTNHLIPRAGYKEAPSDAVVLASNQHVFIFTSKHLMNPNTSEADSLN